MVGVSLRGSGGLARVALLLALHCTVGGGALCLSHDFKFYNLKSAGVEFQSLKTNKLNSYISHFEPLTYSSLHHEHLRHRFHIYMLISIVMISSVCW